MSRWLWISFRFTEVTCATRYWATVSFPVPGKPLIWMIGLRIVPGMLTKSDVVEIFRLGQIWEYDINLYNIYKRDVEGKFIGRGDKLLELEHFGISVEGTSYISAVTHE